MVTKLVQKHPLKGTRIFEIIDDTVNVQIKLPFKKEESLTVMLTVLNQEPVISKSRLEFTSRVNNEALLSLYLAKPNAEEFNAFVTLLKQKIQEEFSAFAGLKTGKPSGLEGNVYEEPPAFDEPDTAPTAKYKEVTAEGIEEAINMLSKHIGTEDIAPFLSALEALKTNPQSEEHLSTVMNEFHALGSTQGAVLTYAPYIATLLSDDPFSF
ncbi:hypothetical protein [Solemya elarraichensis gill symbiont]|uniref:Uncharacterized protein n=1 Tax=Solemya elarraichensis gill symbiont TaxID=1918949 RepID=A0A1T2LC45_9GAMM|nr:hypothetical protein [Solemya elarraichensis gill symbiont]OOZ42668.1 hypothetical protein BOW52_02100 [Solemya elarraichensis gill symbiont]